MKYKEALEYLDSFFNLEKVPHYRYPREVKLERMRDLLSCFGNPQDYFLTVHIAGSKGKGTTAVSLYQILKTHGLNVGLYTSPHLISLRERIRVSVNKTADPLGFGDTISVVPALLGNPLLNVTTSQASKPHALHKLLDPRQIPLTDVVAFGDDMPDLDMLQECGIPIAMGNAFPEVKAVCRYQTASNDDDGVAIALEKMLEILG